MTALPRVSGVTPICTTPIAPDEIIRVQGERTSLTNDVWIDLWSGAANRYAFPPQAQDLEIVSSSVADTASGVGTQAVRLVLLDANFDRFEHIVEMNGTTAVPVPGGPYLRKNLCAAYRSGDSEYSQGKITLQKVGGGEWAIMNAGTNEARDAVYTVPRNYAAALITAHAQMRGRKASALIEAKMEVRTPGLSWRMVADMEFDEVENSTFASAADVANRVEGPLDVRVSAKGSGNVDRVTTNFLIHEWSTK